MFPEQRHNFRKQLTNNLNSPYDYGSLMHYGRWADIWGRINKYDVLLFFREMLNTYMSCLVYFSFRYAFSEDGGPTIIPVPDPYVPIGQRDGPSLLDLHKINVLYNCGGLNDTHKRQNNHIWSSVMNCFFFSCIFLQVWVINWFPWMTAHQIENHLFLSDLETGCFCLLARTG